MAQLEIDSRERLPGPPKLGRWLSLVGGHNLDRQAENARFQKELEASHIRVEGIKLDRRSWQGFFGPEITPANFFEKLYPDLWARDRSSPQITLCHGERYFSKQLSVKIEGYVTARDRTPVHVKSEWTLDPQQREARIDYLSVGQNGQHKGLGPEMLGMMPFLRRSGYESVTLTANIDAGAYFWQKTGFFVKSLEVAQSMLGKGDRQSGQVGLRLEEIGEIVRAEGARRALSGEERRQVEEFSRGLEGAARILALGREHVEAKDLHAAQLILPMIAGLRVETPRFVQEAIRAKKDRDFDYDRLQPDTLGKALLCGTKSEVVYDFNDERARALRSFQS